MKYKFLLEDDKKKKDKIVSESLISNKQKLMELVKEMKPLEIAKVLSKHGLCPDKAAEYTVGLMTKARQDERTNDANNSDDKNWYITKRGVSAYIPPDDRPDKVVFKSFQKMRDNKKIEKESSLFARPTGKTDTTPRFPFKRYEFPPAPIAEPEGFPYDDMNKAGMNPKNKGKKRPLMQGKSKNDDPYSFVGKKNPFDMNPKKNLPAHIGSSGNPVSKMTQHSADNAGSTGGAWNTRGYYGWSKSPPGKEFDMPPGVPKAKKEGEKKYKFVLKGFDAEEEKETPEFLKQEPVGSRIPILGFGGRIPTRRVGFRMRGTGNGR